MNRLLLTYSPDDDWHGELQVEAEAFGFAGSGSAWFTRGRLLDFASALQAYPILADQPAILSDEIIGPDGTCQPHAFRLRIGPVNGTGALVVDVELSTSPYASVGFLHQSCRLSFSTGYADLDRFRVAFINMLDEGQQVELTGSAS